jgi:hypothetical protein
MWTQHEQLPKQHDVMGYWRARSDFEAIQRTPCAMSRRAPWHPRIYPAPFASLIFDARIDAIAEEAGSRGSGQSILVDISALSVPAQPLRVEVGGGPAERVRGERVPYRLRFRAAEWLRRTGPYARFDELPPEDDARRLFYLVHLRDPHYGPRYVFLADNHEPGELVLRARGVTLERREGPVTPVEYVRCYRAAPTPPARLVPRPLRLHARHGGDPIRVRLGGRVYARRLFIGGLHHQRSLRPAVDCVLNLSGIENPWAFLTGRHPADRFAPKGEMRAGMRAAELLDEARWVAAALREGRRVLVHCAAGINRSASVCCAALILLEELSPEAALARLRERHPEAHPDPYHWFALRHLHRQLTRGRGGERLRFLARGAAPTHVATPVPAPLRPVRVVG